MIRLLSCALATVLALAASPSLAAEASHSFDLTYRHFGPVTATSGFQPQAHYAVRFEGCYAKHSEEAICGFTLRATAPLSLSNAANASHGSDASGGAIRTCCLFVQGDDRGYPITTEPAPVSGAALIDKPLKPGESVGVMLRVPNYKQAAPLTAITVSTGHGDAGVRFPAHVVELP